MRVTIETERLILRPMTPDDAEAVYKWGSDPLVNKYLPYPLYTNVDDVEKWLRGRNTNDPDNYDLGITLKDTGELIGSGGLTYKGSDTWEVGYNLRRDMWGKGYVPEAMRAIIEHVKRVRGIKVLTGIYASENTKSRRVLEKLGLHYAGNSVHEKMDGSAVYPGELYTKKFD